MHRTGPTASTGPRGLEGDLERPVPGVVLRQHGHERNNMGDAHAARVRAGRGAAARRTAWLRPRLVDRRAA